MRETAVASAFPWLALVSGLAVACGSKAGGTFGDSTSPEGGASSGGADSGDDGAASTFADGGVNLMLGDTGTSSGLGTGTCKDGTYSGTFQCTFVFGGDAAASADAGGLMITGTISFSLAQMTGNGESFNHTASGTFMGTAIDLFAISADVGGTLNCNTGEFQGNLTNGMYSGFIFITGSFSGPLSSQYDGTTFSFVDGAWLLSVPGQGSCPGTWTANYTGDQ